MTRMKMKRTMKSWSSNVGKRNSSHIQQQEPLEEQRQPRGLVLTSPPRQQKDETEDDDPFGYNQMGFDDTWEYPNLHPWTFDSIIGLVRGFLLLPSPSFLLLPLPHFAALPSHRHAVSGPSSRISHPHGLSPYPRQAQHRPSWAHPDLRSCRRAGTLDVELWSPGNASVLAATP